MHYGGGIAKQLGSKDEPKRVITEMPPSNPIGSEPFRALRELRKVFGSGGIPPKEQRTSEDEARIAAFCALQEIVHILDQFRRSIEKGERCHLVVSEHGRQLGRVVIELAITDEHT